jgi:hypothetical protein
MRLLLIELAYRLYAGGVLNTLLNNELFKSVYSEENGGTLGLSLHWKASRG